MSNSCNALVGNALLTISGDQVDKVYRTHRAEYPVDGSCCLKILLLSCYAKGNSFCTAKAIAACLSDMNSKLGLSPIHSLSTDIHHDQHGPVSPLHIPNAIGIIWLFSSMPTAIRFVPLY
ncbi:hypothetical protein Tco_0482426 [Tanacetum coccineum]